MYLVFPDYFADLLADPKFQVLVNSKEMEVTEAMCTSRF